MARIARKIIVDFDEAKQSFDISPTNIKAVMSERTEHNYIEHNDYEDKWEVCSELIKRYNINTNRLDDDLAVKMAIEIKARSGASIREMAIMLEVNRERLRKAMSIPPSP